LLKKKAGKASLYLWLAGLLACIIILREECFANLVICAAIICAFGSGWSVAIATSKNASSDIQN